MKETIIPCAKCHAPGILYSKRSMAALIASKPIAHVLHLTAAPESTRSFEVTTIPNEITS